MATFLEFISCRWALGNGGGDCLLECTPQKLNPVYGGKGFNRIQWFLGRRYRRQTAIRCLEAGGDDADRPFAQKYDQWCVSKVLKFGSLGSHLQLQSDTSRSERMYGCRWKTAAGNES
jgi:hypothetical protein